MIPMVGGKLFFNRHEFSGLSRVGNAPAAD
jgi:hypothetical protein